MTDPSRRLSPFATGLSGRCPRCGEGHLFSGFLTLAERCEICGLDFGFADSGDGPAVLIMFPVGTIVVVGWVVTETVLGWPSLVNLLLWAVMTFVLSIALLRPFKGVMVNLQYKTGARDGGELDGGEPDPRDDT